MTTYDDIFTEFETIYRTETYNLPSSDDGNYKLIKSSVKHFNSVMEDSTLQCDDLTETVNQVLTDNHLIILAHCIKYICLDNQLDYYITTFKPFTKEIGLLHYQADINMLKVAIEKERQEIYQLIENEKEDFM